MSGIQERIAALDTTLFDSIESLTWDWDRRALLALHEAVAATLGSFNYLEIGSYRGGSLQAVMQDPRCARVFSIDPRPAFTPDKRTGTWSYGEQSPSEMLAALRRLPSAEMSKLTTFDVGTDALRLDQLPVKADYCFIDGEHTDEAVLRDARFCSAALHGSGVIAFHDSDVIEPAIRAFLREAWPTVSYALAFTGPVFALELGDRGLLRSAVVDRAISSTWHGLLWRFANRQRRSASTLLAAWSAMRPIDAAVFNARARWRDARSRVGPRSFRRSVPPDRRGAT